MPKLETIVIWLGIIYGASALAVKVRFFETIGFSFNNVIGIGDIFSVNFFVMSEALSIYAFYAVVVLLIVTLRLIPEIDAVFSRFSYYMKNTWSIVISSDILQIGLVSIFLVISRLLREIVPNSSLFIRMTGAALPTAFAVLYVKVRPMARNEGSFFITLNCIFFSHALGIEWGNYATREDADRVGITLSKGGCVKRAILRTSSYGILSYSHSSDVEFRPWSEVRSICPDLCL
jgi:hypothetical protein